MTHSQWMVKAKAMLAEGFGVEDIAVKMGINVKGVRAYVRQLRRHGDLDAILRRGLFYVVEK